MFYPAPKNIIDGDQQYVGGKLGRARGEKTSSVTKSTYWLWHADYKLFLGAAWCNTNTSIAAMIMERTYPDLCMRLVEYTAIRDAHSRRQLLCEYTHVSTAVNITCLQDFKLHYVAL